MGWVTHSALNGPCSDLWCQSCPLSCLLGPRDLTVCCGVEFRESPHVLTLCLSSHQASAAAGDIYHPVIPGCQPHLEASGA